MAFVAEVLVLDFEATCDRLDDQSCPQDREIIEFPVVRLAGIPLQEVERFHCYVRPANGRQISAFCTELTGITAEQVNAAHELPQVLNDFVCWLQARGLDEALLTEGAVVVAHGEWDLNDQLPAECRRKGIPLPQCLHMFTDIKTVFDEATVTPRPLHAG